MNVVYHELLPESYLLILAPGNSDGSEESLAHWLNRAECSGRSAVWVDCGMLSSLSNEAVQLLWATHRQLLVQHAQLVLVHVSDRVQREILGLEALGSAPCFVPTLLDAALQTHWHQNNLAA